MREYSAGGAGARAASGLWQCASCMTNQYVAAQAAFDQGVISRRSGISVRRAMSLS